MNIYNEELKLQLRDYLKTLQITDKKKINDAISTYLGISKDFARRINKKYNIFPESVLNNKNSVVEEKVVTVKVDSPKSLEEVVKLCNIDEKLYAVKSFSVEGKDKFNWRISFEKKEIDFNEIFNSFINCVKDYSPKYFKFNPIDINKNHLYVLNIHDLHLASLVSSKETGFGNYDINIAKQVFIDAVSDLMSKIDKSKVSDVVVIAGSDFFNVDNDNMETFNHTRVDTDSRVSKMFDEGCKLLINIIDNLSKDFKVKVVVIPGNHDRTTATYLGAYLSAWYRLAGDRIFIDNAPTARKYVRHFQTIIGFEHGDKTPLKNLPLVFINECTDLSLFKCKTFLTGHLHGDHAREIAGIQIRTSPSLSAHTKWASDMGLIGNIRCAQGLLFAPDHLVAINYSKPVE